jgi:hypothetical protein
MSDAKFKRVFAFTVLFLTVGWAIFAVVMTYFASKSLDSINVIVAGGADVLLGSMISWTNDVKQYFFRKKVGLEDDAPEDDGKN